MSSKRSIHAAALLLVAASCVAPGCSGNVNDDSVNVLNLRLMSLSSGGTFGNSSSRNAKLSFDGRVVAFESSASNLDPRDTNTISDIYIRDTQINTTTLVSVSSTGTTSGNNFSNRPAISPNGQYVAWGSSSSNLVAGLTDANGTSEDIFVRDVVNGVTHCASCTAASSTTTGNGFSSSFDGIAVTSDAGNVYVVFASSSTDMTAPATTGFNQIFLRRIPLVAGLMDNTAGVTFLVSQIGPATTGNNSSNRRATIGQDATNVYVAWQSFATDQVATDATSTEDVYWRPMLKATGAAGAVAHVSINTGGTAGGNAASQNPSISDDGNFVVWDSTATDLIPAALDANGSTRDIFRRGPMTGAATTSIVSLGTSGTQSTQDCQLASVSATGQFVCFQSAAPDLVPPDTAGFVDVFVRDVTGGSTRRSSLTALGSEPNSPCQNGAISGDGQFVAFDSSASNMIVSGGTFAQQVYRRGP